METYVLPYSMTNIDAVKYLAYPNVQPVVFDILDGLLALRVFDILDSLLILIRRSTPYPKRW